MDGIFRPGQGAFKAESHHCIVTGVDLTNDVLYSVDGNQAYNTIRKLTRRISQVDWHYKISQP